MPPRGCIRPMVFALAAMTLVHCADLASVSSGHIGCAPSDIVISDEDQGFSTLTWTATCHGKRFYCTTLYGKDSSQASCRRAVSEPVATPKPKAIEWVEKHGESWRFSVPGDWVQGPLGGHLVYHPANSWAPHVFIEFEPKEDDAAAFAKEEFAASGPKRFDTGAAPPHDERR